MVEPRFKTGDIIVYRKKYNTPIGISKWKDRFPCIVLYVYPDKYSDENNGDGHTYRVRNLLNDVEFPVYQYEIIDWESEKQEILTELEKKLELLKSI